MWWVIGTAGLLAIEASYVPQIVRLGRLRRADDVSLLFPALNATGRVLALTYSILSSQPVFIAGFVVGLLLRTTLLSQVIWYRYLRPRVRAVPVEAAVESGAAPAVESAS
jgi:lipid-A-disaccharide synthase-like uncharacterized protein